MSLLSELKRRNVFRVGVTYAVVAWLLVQVSTTVLPQFGAPGWITRALIIALIAGALPLLLLTWAFELTPEGVKTQAEADAAGLPSRIGGARLNVAVGALLVVALGLFALGRYSATPDQHSTTAPAQVPPSAGPTAPPPAADEASIAVLPFVNMSADKDNEYFCDGLSETLLDMLTQVPNLKVPARTSSFAFKGKSEDVRGIAAALGVAHLLEGSVQKAGDTVRITAQLVRASDGNHVWSKRFDRQLTDVFKIQDEIATEVVGALKIALLPAAEQRLTQRRTESLDAYQEYLKGVALMPKRRVADLAAAAAHFERAITLDPAFAKAYVGAADAYRLLYDYGSPTDEQRARGERYTNRALELAPDLGEAHATLAQGLVLKGDMGAAEREFRRAIELAPSYATAHHWYALMLRRHLGRYAEALVEAERAAELDPLSPIVQSSLAGSQYAAGRVAEHRETISKLVRQHPDFGIGVARQAQIAASDGDLVAALRAFRTHDAIDPDAIVIRLGSCTMLLDYSAFAEAERCIAKVAVRAPEQHPAVSSARGDLALFAGRHAEALALFSPDPDRVPYSRSVALVALDRPTEALEMLRRVLPHVLVEPVPEISPSDRRMALLAGSVLLKTGASAHGRALIARVLENLGSQASSPLEKDPWFEVMGRELLGQREAAILALERAVGAGSFVGLSYLDGFPPLAGLRADPRYERIVAPARAKAAEQVRLAKAAGLL